MKYQIKKGIVFNKQSKKSIINLNVFFTSLLSLTGAVVIMILIFYGFMYFTLKLKGLM